MEVPVEVEDDVFFADLSKQISLLIMDDEKEDTVADHHCPSVSPQVFSQAISPATQTWSSILYEQTYYQRRESKGTGVFIPARNLSHPRRKHNNIRQGRHNPPKTSRHVACTNSPNNGRKS